MPERTKEWIISMIAYEKHKGIHTYHLCKCGRNNTRAGKCWQCLEEELKEMETNNAREER
jgi:hypothetical protein